MDDQFGTHTRGRIATVIPLNDPIRRHRILRRDQRVPASSLNRPTKSLITATRRVLARYTPDMDDQLGTDAWGLSFLSAWAK